LNPNGISCFGLDADCICLTGCERLKQKVAEVYGRPPISYGAHQPQAMELRDAPPNRAVAKLKTQVQPLKRQIEAIESILDEL
jgi:hypothetical protein